jgi:glutamate N-acetyltransferase/amino-acid N-acetyltransferase
VTRESCDSNGIRAVVVNSGNANAATGQAGVADALMVRAAVATSLGLQDSSVAVCSTGVIGQRLNAQLIVDAIPDVIGSLDANGEAAFAEAIRTTDKTSKQCALDVELSGGTVRISAQGKGAGMIQPSFATMLCFIQTDAVLTRDTAELLLGATVRRSFERISVDGQLSTNDAVILMASGESGIEVKERSADEIAFGEALDTLLRALALEIVADGEGAVRVGRVVVEGGDDSTVEHVARTVAGSPLVKSALHGGDPNWGRILQAVGMALPDQPGLPIDIEIEGTCVCSAGVAAEFDENALAQAVAGPEVEYLIRVPGSGSACEVFFSDLSHEYVTINSEYTT